MYQLTLAITFAINLNDFKYTYYRGSKVGYVFALQRIFC